MPAKRILWVAGFLAFGIQETCLADIINFSLQMDGNQASACAGTGSPHTGTGTLSLDTDTGTVNFNISFTGLTTPEINAHTHGPAPECINAGVVQPLPPGNPKVGSYVLTPAQQADMIAGLHYVNIHSEAHPGGEIRGQILQFEGVPAASTWGIVVLALVVLAGAKVVYGRRRALS